jgi:hypothetical protein
VAKRLENPIGTRRIVGTGELLLLTSVWHK